MRIHEKINGFLMASTTVNVVVFVLMAGAIAGLYSSMFTMQLSMNTASTAQQYAEIESNTLALLRYDDLPSAAHGKKISRARTAGKVKLRSARKGRWTEEIGSA